MFYYLLGFIYPGPAVNIPHDSDVSRAASAANFDADEKIAARAKAAGLEMRGAYAWPDGSLYNYIRTTQKFSRQDFEQLFDGDGIFIVSLQEEIAPQILGSGIDVITLEEKFAGLPREEHNALLNHRHAEREALFADYRKARDECDDCTAPGLGCKKCHAMCNAAFETEKKWRAEPRPLTSANDVLRSRVTKH
jgi:hypothetical protein